MIKDLVKKNRGSSSVEFIIGIVCLAAGLFMFSQRIVVNTGFYSWRLWGFSISSGLVVVPLLIGIIWLFFDFKSKIAKVIIALGFIFIIATVIMSIKIYFMATSFFDYILMLGLAAAGAGLLLKAIAGKKNENK